MNTLKQLDIIVVVFCYEGEDDLQTTHIYDNECTLQQAKEFIQAEHDQPVEVISIAR